MNLPPEARGLVRRTPLVYAPPLGCFLKLESLQATGSFKLRGAAVKLARLSAADRARGVVVASAGNHGLGIAYAAKKLSVSATVIVSRGSARVKREGIARMGAEVIVSEGEYQVAEREARALASDSGRVFVSPFDDDDVIDGNGAWLAEEMLEQHATVKRVVVPVGGGGLAGGIARALQPKGVQVIGVQPAVNCAMRDSIEQGRALTEYQGGATACEGLEGAVAERTYELCLKYLDRIHLVEEKQISPAIALAYRMGVIVEASAAVVIAAAPDLMAEDDTILVVTGSNIDPSDLDLALRW